jgi:predicted GIY-YIG superfamily endonuclease
MERVGNYTKRLVYAYEFPDNSVYIGLTYNKLQRHNDHINKSKSAVYKKINQLNFTPIMKIISESYIDAEEARKLEDETINIYLNKGWQILNSAKAGGLGGTKNISKVLFKDKESCHTEALKYSSKKEFRENSLLAYRRAYDLNCLDEICSHMKVKSIPFEECNNEALKYSRVIDFIRNSPKHYYRAYSMGWIDKICLHMRRISKGWNEQLILIESKKYSTREEFRKNSSGAYSYARKHKLLNSACLHMKPLLTKWTKEMVLAEVSKYTTHLDFRLKSPKAYDAARNHGWLPEIKAMLQHKYNSLRNNLSK